jgi:putative nucleotidyltransferase with HDIG domain
VITLEELAKEVHDLAPLPAAAARLAHLAADEDAEVKAIVDTIRYDQALTARVLRYANSPAAGSLYPIRSIKDAVVRLGLGKLLEIAIGAQVEGRMRRALPEYGLGEDEMWAHAAAAALGAELLIRNHSSRCPPVAFTAALLHDIGKLVLARHLDPNVQKTIRKLTRDYGMAYYRAELEILDFTHATIGARIAEHWHLGQAISDAISSHHEQDAEGGPVSDVVRIGNMVAKTAGYGLGFEGMNLAADPGACARLGIDGNQFEGLCAEAAARMTSVRELGA